MLEKPSRSGRRELKAAPFMRREYYTQIHCLPASCVRSAEQNELREDMRQYNQALKNTAQVLMDQYVWRSASNLPGQLYRVEKLLPGRRKGSGLQPQLSRTTPELEQQVRAAHQGLLCAVPQGHARKASFERSAHRQSADDSLRRVGSREQLSEAFWKTRKDPEADRRIFLGECVELAVQRMKKLLGVYGA